MSSRPVDRARREGGESAAPRRADAERNIATILRTTADLLAVDPGVSLVEIAKAAGVGRVTLYSHFASRSTLLEAVATMVIGEADAALASADLDALPPEEALRELLRTSWQVLDRFNRLRVSAAAEIGEQRLRELHDHGFSHLERLIARGQESGDFRTDLEVPWLVTVFYALMHAAGDQVAAGSLRAADVPALLADTTLPLLRGGR
ncbi:MAG TPA: TetR/AcrR family transcriptional regulator [Marmoricola sp.]|nr:TetR/AcrR family transcriptional regulator [Marmoricola sp.]